MMRAGVIHFEMKQKNSAAFPRTLLFLHSQNFNLCACNGHVGTSLLVFAGQESLHL